jgi:16S rRNA (uracil1498-N3)-methyltransferase
LKSRKTFSFVQKRSVERIGMRRTTWGDGEVRSSFVARDALVPIIAGVMRRLHARRLFVGRIPLDPVQTRHAREVLRLPDGATVELFDDQGASATGKLVFIDDHATAVDISEIAEQKPASGPQVIVASAVPKGERADWMVEKLSELGVAAIIPLSADRSVVLPKGAGKLDRWTRIATESAKQSRRTGVMRIEPLTPLKELVSRKPNGLLLSTDPAAKSILDACDARFSGELVLFIGPEGGWTDLEIQGFSAAGIQPVRLMNTILRVETAAIAAAAVVQTLIDQANPNRV